MRDAVAERMAKSHSSRTASITAALPPIDWSRLDGERVSLARGAAAFVQGAPATSVLYLESGTVKLSVVSKGGKQAVVTLVKAGTFFGEGCLAGQPKRIATAVAVETCSLLRVELDAMRRHLAASPVFAHTFLMHMLSRNIRVEEDLVDQLFNSSEKRLARTLLLLARYGERDAEHHVIPRLSQEVLAEMVGTTRSRVNFFMNKFRRLGFIEYNGELKVHASLLTVALRD
jgi:CRP/FNR family transcriptional regulator, cyclic AMP receptor protein